VADPGYGPAGSPIEVMPVVVLSQIFTARPSSIPDIRNFVRRCLAESPLTEEGNRQVSNAVFRALLDAAGPDGSIHVAFRIFPEHVEVDVLHSDTAIQQAGAHGPAAAMNHAHPASAPPLSVPVPPASQAARPGVPAAATAGASATAGAPAGPTAGPPAGASADGPASAQPAAISPAEPVVLGQPGHPASFAEWMSSALRREGLTQEAAARQLGVSVKTVSRWVGGATEPRMRDLRRIQEVFGEVPLP
jgi:DNA-binding XRE family transcriptional regulator